MSSREMFQIVGRRISRARFRRSFRAYRTAQFTSAPPSKHSSIDNEEQGKSMLEHKNAILQSALDKVHTHGWTKEAISAAVQEQKYSVAMVGMVAPADLVSHCMDDWNNQLKEAIDKEQFSKEGNQNQFLYQALRFRLSLTIPYIRSGRWHEGMALGLQSPQQTQAQLHRIIELVAPSASVMEQARLGAIYAATELHLLTDASEDYQASWALLQESLEQGFLSPSTLSSSLSVAASSAVVFSLMEGIASVVLPSSMATSASSMDVPGTSPSDYVSKQK